MTDIIHGTWRAYRRQGCKCPDCRHYANRVGKEVRLRQLAGVGGFVPRQPVIDHLQRLLTSGMTLQDIADDAGLTSASSLGQMLKYDSDRIQAMKARAILSVRPRPRPTSRARVTTTGSTRRLRALARIGWRITDIADATGISYVTLTYLRRGEAKTVTASVHQRIRDFYEANEVNPGPSRRTAEHAAAQKWLPPLAWDNIDGDTSTAAWRRVTYKRQEGFRTL